MDTRSRLVALALVVGLTACGEDPAEPKDTTPEVDSGTAQDAGAKDADTRPADTGVPVPVVDPTLPALAGRYLLRFDNFGTAMASGFTIRSRVSVLVTAELTVDGNKLTAKERVCDQTVVQQCKDNTCQSATTVVDPRAISDFLVKRTFAREYTVDGANFRAGLASYALGYDDAAGGSVPTSATDTRVWDVVKGDPREGLLTKVTVALPLPGLPPFTCSAYGTQKFSSQFSGTLQGTGASASFPTAELETDLEGSDAKTLGSEPSGCASNEGTTSTVEKVSVRLARVGKALPAGEIWSCPSTAEFDSKLPGTPL